MSLFSRGAAASGIGTAVQILLSHLCAHGREGLRRTCLGYREGRPTGEDFRYGTARCGKAWRGEARRDALQGP